MKAGWSGPVGALAVAAVLAGHLPSQAQRSGQAPVEALAQKAREAAVTLGDRLRSELGAAIKSKGAVSAIAFCQTFSPDLTTTAADEFGFEVVRTSLRLRNPENAPDDWELKVLQLFQAKIAGGTDPLRLEHYEVTTTAEGEKLFRYMKPIMTTELCLGCHGNDVKQDVKAEIARYYPEDKALGYKLGELRGAFSLAQFIED